MAGSRDSLGNTEVNPLTASSVSGLSGALVHVTNGALYLTSIIQQLWPLYLEIVPQEIRSGSLSHGILVNILCNFLLLFSGRKIFFHNEEM